MSQGDGPADPTQEGLRAALGASAALAARVGTRIYDRIPDDPPPAFPYLHIPDGIFTPMLQSCDDGPVDADLGVAVYSETPGQTEARQIADIVVGVLGAPGAIVIDGWEVVESYWVNTQPAPEPDGLRTRVLVTFHLILQRAD